MMYREWDEIIIHWIHYKVEEQYLMWMYESNDEVFNVLWIKDKYDFCWTPKRDWIFPVHRDLKHLNETIQNLLNYRVWDISNGFYKSLMYGDV